MDVPAELKLVERDLQSAKTVTPVTIRTFLGWFGAQRRTEGNVAYINDRLSKLKIRTVPHYLNIWVDTPITFELIKAGSGQNNDNQSATEPSSSDDGIVEVNDPSFRVGNMEEASRGVTYVKPNATLNEVVTLMIANNFSQIPVMQNDRDVRGVITWASIGIKLHSSKINGEARLYMLEKQEISAATSLFTALKIIQDNGYVLIRATDQTISGIITAYDISNQFEKLSAPFLLLSEIENHLRLMISAKLSIADIKRTCDPSHLPSNFINVNDLSFGNCVKILENHENWNKLGINWDRNVFCKELAIINEIRNNVMHFDPDSNVDADVIKLRNASRMLNMLREVGAF